MKKLLMCCSLLVISLVGCGSRPVTVDGKTVYTEDGSVYTEEMRAEVEKQAAQDLEDYLREHGDEFKTGATGAETADQPGGDAAGKSPAN